MTSFEFRFIDGLSKKTLILGGILAGVLGVLVGPWMALSTAIGAATAFSNLYFIRWVSHKMVERAKAGNTSVSPWSAIIVLKMLILFGLVWYLIARLGIDAPGFVAGFSAFLPAIGWQVWASRDDETLIPPDDETEIDG